MKKPVLGHPAPDFVAEDQHGAPVRLSDFRGKKIVLFFYPRDLTPGCTREACNLRDHYQRLDSAGYVVLGVSTDGKESHRKFIDKHDLPFVLLDDADRKMHELYHTWVEKSMFGRKYMGTRRVTFIIDEGGILTNVIEDVKVGDHAAQILGSGI